MSNIKHKLFKVKILKDKSDFDDKSLKIINDFLQEANHVYINHSISIITNDYEKFGIINTVATDIVISLIYKDLVDTELNLNSTKNKTKNIIHKQVLENNTIEEPFIETEFEKERSQLSNGKTSG